MAAWSVWLASSSARGGGELGTRVLEPRLRGLELGERRVARTRRGRRLGERGVPLGPNGVELRARRPRSPRCRAPAARGRPRARHGSAPIADRVVSRSSRETTSCASRRLDLLERGAELEPRPLELGVGLLELGRVIGLVLELAEVGAEIEHLGLGVRGSSRRLLVPVAELRHLAADDLEVRLGRLQLALEVVLRALQRVALGGDRVAFGRDGVAFGRHGVALRVQLAADVLERRDLGPEPAEFGRQLRRRTARTRRRLVCPCRCLVGAGLRLAGCFLRALGAGVGLGEPGLGLDGSGLGMCELAADLFGLGLEPREVRFGLGRVRADELELGLGLRRSSRLELSLRLLVRAASDRRELRPRGS